MAHVSNDAAHVGDARQRIRLVGGDRANALGEDENLV